MSWSTAELPDACVVRPQGKIDESNWQDFADRLDAAIRALAPPRMRLVIDFAGVDYMSSRGLRALTLARKAAGDGITIVLARPNPRMREIFAISRYDKIFSVTDAIDQDKGG